MSDELNLVGKHNKKINDILGLEIEELDIFRSSGLITHLLKRQHYSAIKYLDKIPDIIQNPDYVGVNPNESDVSVEYIKEIGNTIFLVGVKKDTESNCLYVSTMHDITPRRRDKALRSGRFKSFVDNN